MCALMKCLFLQNYITHFYFSFLFYSVPNITHKVASSNILAWVKSTLFSFVVDLLQSSSVKDQRERNLHHHLIFQLLSHSLTQSNRAFQLLWKRIRIPSKPVGWQVYRIILMKIDDLSSFFWSGNHQTIMISSIKQWKKKRNAMPTLYSNSEVLLCYDWKRYVKKKKISYKTFFKKSTDWFTLNSFNKIKINF